MDVFGPLRDDPRISALVERTANAQGPVFVEGLWGSCAPLVAALVADRLRRPLLLVTAHADDADNARDDIETLTGRLPEIFPQLEAASRDAAGVDELAGERLRLCMRCMSIGGAADAALMIVAPLMALIQPVPSIDTIRRSSMRLASGDSLDPEKLAGWLEEHGYTPCDAVELPGEFARRGGILDIFSQAHDRPVRLEFFDDQLESIRLFEAGTQRSDDVLAAVQIPALSVTRAAAAARDAAPSQRKAALLQETNFLLHLPPQTIICFHEPTDIAELGRTLWQRLNEPIGYTPPEGLFRIANGFTQLYLQRFGSGEADAIRLPVSSLPHFDAKPAEALLSLAELAREHAVIVLCEKKAEAERFHELLAGPAAASAAPADGSLASPAPTAATAAAPINESSGDPAAPDPFAARRTALPPLPAGAIQTAVGLLHHGFVWERRAYVPNAELFSRAPARRILRRVAPARPLDSFFDLAPGDNVVHTQHGIGRFVGLKPIAEGERDEYLQIEFAEGAAIHVPASQIHLVQKYIGSFQGTPKLSKLGGNAWKKTKERVADSVADLAGELLVVQAQRATQPGLAYPQDTAWQREFEGSFPYEETPDQLRALAEIKNDLNRPRPMDRLLCGDVGFGKTELAMRAAFKVAEYGKQVAVLVPTTVLAEQHYQSFRSRLADYPFTIEALSRFRADAEQKRIVERLAKGRIDVIIGTHRLLSKDVRFADLGLVVIDEEQRFGVDAKERLKRLRATVDVLTLSATPIPRTLHFSMLGIRDISSLATPPLDRRSIVTQVRPWEDALIREALLRELNRDGQAYFVHNFVRDIEAVANTLRTLVPEARCVVGHGQMGPHELEEVMLKFMRREADVLVSTNIIESGIDIATANTIFINRADRFGLADLHQLRGRVGRSKHRAYCYLLLPPGAPLKDTAARRLKAIEQYSELGAGFQIAMRDLEIRGAGNMLGPEQSGHIEAVGYEMYCQLLEEATRRLKNEPATPFRQVNLDLGARATIPRAYIRADRQRMDVYKRLTACRTADDIAALRSDLRDAFGPWPAEVERLLKLAAIRVLSQPWGIRSIIVKPPDVIFAVDEVAQTEALFQRGPGSPRAADNKTVHWRVPKKLLEPDALVDALVEQLTAAG